MRTYRNLYAEFISDENIKLAIQNFSKGKKRRNKVRKILADLDTYIPKIREYAINFTPFEHKPKEIYDGISRKKHKISTVDRKARCIEYDRIQARRKYAIGQTA